MTTRCGMVAIVGEPNSGKSTLINRLVGGKVSIVTPKAQTTRFNVRGVCVHEQTQLIFIDTPGIFDADKKFEQAMVGAAWAGLGEADAALVLVDAKQGLTEGVKRILEKLSNNKSKPVCLALNKIDQVKKPALLALAIECEKLGKFDAIFMISARNGDGVEDVKKSLTAHMPEGPFLYPEEQMSDISMRLLAAEITREKLFLLLGQELPYATFVETEHWEEEGTKLKISQIIYVQRDGQKKIVIGAGGAMLKRIGSSARRELEKVVGKKLHLSLFVKVKPGWKDDREYFSLLGLEYKK